LCYTHPVDELEYFVRDSQASLIIAAGQHTQHIQQLAIRCGVQFISLECAGELKELVEEEEGEEDEMENDDSDALIIYTSGTTGKVRSYQNVCTVDFILA
jgi:long-subunit acyl-CoA synthetase (AMP-forming)